MPLFSFLKITDNNDPYTFSIETTSMQNPRSRMSCLRTNLFAWEDTCTLTTAYNIQQDGDEGMATITKSGKPRKTPAKKSKAIVYE